MGPKTRSKNGAFQTGPPQLQLHLVRQYAAGFNLTVESECVFKTSSNWVLHLSSCIQGRTGGIGRYFSIVSRFCNSKNELKSGFPHRNAGRKMGPFSEPSVIVPMLEGSRNGPGFRAYFWSRFSLFSERRFSQKMVASRCCCDDKNLSQFLSCFRSQHDSLSCCRIRDNDSNKAVQLCN